MKTFLHNQYSNNVKQSSSSSKVLKNEKNLFEFVWTLRSLVWVVFNNFLLIDTTDRSKISSDQKHLFFVVTYTSFHFSRTLPLRQLRKHKNSEVAQQRPSPLCIEQKGIYRPETDENIKNDT